MMELGLDDDVIKTVLSDCRLFQELLFLQRRMPNRELAL